MRQRLCQVGLALLVASFTGCAASTPHADSADTTHMTPVEAQAFITQAQAERGTPVAARMPVTSMEQFLEIVLADDVGRFPDAAAFVEGKPGLDALALHATLELTWSDLSSTVAAVVRELRKRAEANSARLKQRQESAEKLTPAEQEQLDRAQKDAAYLEKAKMALDVLAADHLRHADQIVNEVLRQFPRDPRTYRVAAFDHLLNGDWPNFDKAMTWLKDSATEDAGVQYLFGLEALQRFAVRNDARNYFEGALHLNPKLVRARAKLVLIQEDIRATHDQLEQLKAIAPRHAIVNIAGPSLNSEYETATALDRARATPGAAPMSAPTPAPAPPTPAPAAPGG